MAHGEMEMAISHETLSIKRDIDLPGIGVISGTAEVSVPQVGYESDENGESVFVAFDEAEMLEAVQETFDKPQTPEKLAEEVVRHFNNGLKSALRSGAYASAGSLSAVEDSDDVKNLKKTLDSFVKNFGMQPDQAAAAVKNIPAIQAILTRLEEVGVLKAKSA